MVLCLMIFFVTSLLRGMSSRDMRRLARFDKDRLLPSESNNAKEIFNFYLEWDTLRRVDGTFKEPTTQPEYARNVKVARVYSKLGPVWSKVFSFYFSVIPVDVRRRIHGLLTRLRIDLFRDDKSLRTALSSLSTIAKKVGPGFCEDWKYFVSLDTMGGFLDVEDIGETSILPQVREWVGVRREKDSEFLVLFEQGVRDFFTLNETSVEALSPKAWSSKPWLWGGSGSSSLRFKYQVDHKTVTSRTKWGPALMEDPKMVASILVGDVLPFSTNKAVAKREQTKVRAVVSSDDATYLRMSYVSSWLEAKLRGNARSPLFLSGSRLENFWRGWMTYSRMQTCVKMPLDQSHFDWQASKSMIRIVLKAVYDVVPHVMKKTVAVLMRTLTESRTSVDVLVDGTQVKVPILSGLISGWRWTALIGTCINWAESYAVRRKCIQLYGYDPTLFVAAQGDDDVMVCRDWVSAMRVYRAYKDWGFDLNPKKFFLSTNRDEFLRLITDGHSIVGYPARGVGSVLWRKLGRMVRLRTVEASNAWYTLMKRGLNVFDHWVSDMCGMNDISRDVALGYLYTPASMGGYGLQGKYFGWYKIVSVSEEDTRRVTARVTPPWLQHGEQAARSVSAKLLLGGSTSGVNVRFEPIDVLHGKRVVHSSSLHILPVLQEDVNPLTFSASVGRMSISEILLCFDQKYHAIIVRMYKVCSKNVLIDMLTGKLPYHPPVVMQGSLVIKNTLRPYVNGELARLLNRSKVTRSDLVLSALGVEREVGIKIDSTFMDV